MSYVTLPTLEKKVLKVLKNKYTCAYTPINTYSFTYIHFYINIQRKKKKGLNVHQNVIKILSLTHTHTHTRTVSDLTSLYRWILWS